ncbi:MAG TPA: hypothetical protein VHB25_03215 [Gemmatimonadaceae bacterium]|nr:hypothetical protein [Gemmatimonadaceae bacterium]
MNPDRTFIHSDQAVGTPAFALRGGVRVLAAMAIAALGTACSIDKAVAPDNGGGIHLPMATAQAISEFLPSLSDAQTRVLPSLSDAASAKQLDAELTQIQATLSRSDQAGAEKQISLARATMDGYPTSAAADDRIELSVIGIVVDRAAQLDGMPALANRRAP